MQAPLRSLLKGLRLGFGPPLCQDHVSRDGRLDSIPDGATRELSLRRPLVETWMEGERAGLQTRKFLWYRSTLDLEALRIHAVLVVGGRFVLNSRMVPSSSLA